MATARAASNKAKIARRVIEVLDYFDENHREATVMDIVRRYDRPQSSTSELLSSLVELGLLYKDPTSRAYSLSPRAALLGSAGQSDLVRDGRLVRMTDRLVAQTGLSVALFAMVGLSAQLISWRPGPRACPRAIRGLASGLIEPLAHSAAGWLLLSTVEQRRRDGMIRRLNAEATSDCKFAITGMIERVEQCRMAGSVHGPAGFGASAEIAAALLPVACGDQPLAAGIVFGPRDKVVPDNLLHCLNEAIAQIAGPSDATVASVKAFPTAA